MDSRKKTVVQTQAPPTATPTEVLDSSIVDMSDVFGESVARRGEGVSGDGEGVAGGEMAWTPFRGVWGCLVAPSLVGGLTASPTPGVVSLRTCWQLRPP